MPRSGSLFLAPVHSQVAVWSSGMIYMQYVFSFTILRFSALRKEHQIIRIAIKMLTIFPFMIIECSTQW